ncbi:MAG TPA: 6-phosphogluconolactonase [Rudaea sp.]|nr:6-phosphogluconolactonase [Rudaea sp.]
MTPIALVEHDFDNDESLAIALAQTIAKYLRDAIAQRGHASIALSGGKTPRRLLQCLAEQRLDWSRVTITLADERWVPPGNPRSNEALLREALLRGNAAAARFIPLYVDTPTPEQGLAAVQKNVGVLKLPFDVVVLGMGLDGHCASLFPDGDNLQAALDPESSARVLPMRAPDAGEPRITFTLAALVQTRTLYVQIEGAAKREVFEHIVNGDAGFIDAPIRIVLQHSPVTAELFRSA